MRKIKNGLILAAGDSTRFWPLKDKNFFNFLDESLILYQIKNLSFYCENIFVVVNQNNIIPIKKLLENSNLKKNCQLIIQENLSLGQGGAIISASKYIKGEALIINANDYLDFSILRKIIEIKKDNSNFVFLFGKKINYYFPGGYFRFDNNRIVEVIEKPAKDNLPSNYLKLFLDYFSNLSFLVDELKKNKEITDDSYEKALSSILKSVKSYFIEYNGYWHSLKYPWHVLLMMRIFLEKIKNSFIDKTAQISDKAILIPPIIIKENVRIGDYVKVVGPCYLGENTIVGDYSLVRESQINSDCLIGSYSEIARSYIGNKVFLHRNYIGDSVIDDQVMMGAQAVVANLRFNGEGVTSQINGVKVDSNLGKLGTIIGKNSKIGVNTTIFPGVKIGKNVWILPGETVSLDIKDNIFYKKNKKRKNYYENR